MEVIITMTKRTTWSRIQSYAEKLQAIDDPMANLRIGNSRYHPLPSLPPQDWLEDHWLGEITRSQPHRLSKARELVTYVGKERRY